jgi:hypothetical protein
MLFSKRSNVSKVEKEQIEKLNGPISFHGIMFSEAPFIFWRSNFHLRLFKINTLSFFKYSAEA